MKQRVDALDVEGRSIAGAEQVRAWVAQATDGDVQAALAIAREALIPHPRRHRNLLTARNWLDFAMELGGPDIRWIVAQGLAFADFPEADVEHVRWIKTVWAQAIRRDCAELAPSLRVDPSVLGPIFSSSCSMMTQSWSVAVRTSDVPGAVEALTAAARRFSYVDETGRELTEDEYEANETSSDPVYTPSYVSEPTTDSGVTEVVLDCDGLTSASMARTVLRVAVQECLAVGLHEPALVTTPYHYCPELELSWDETTQSFMAPS